MLGRRGVVAAGGVVAAAGLLGLPASARAAYPDRPVRLVVPFGAGGNLDTLARLVAPGMSRRLGGQPVVIENRPGAGGNLGAEIVATAAPDGYSVLVGSNGGLVTNPLLMARMPYDAARAFAPIGLGFRTPNVLVVSPKLPVTSLAEFIAYAKARPNGVTCASAGIGTTNHLLIELLNAATGMGMVHVPYRASGASMADLLSGALTASMDQITTALPQHRDGALRILGIGLGQRAPLLPEVPTFGEVGLQDGGLVSFIGLLVPAATPEEPRQRLQEALAGALGEPALRERVEAIGNLLATPEERTPAGFAALIVRERELSRRAIALAGLKPE